MNIFQEAKQVLDKDGKVNPFGPYGKSKLTGSEVASYFRQNKVSDPMIKKAVEVALDLGGAYDVARKEIAKFFGDKVLKTKEVQTALRFANEEVFAEAMSKFHTLRGTDIKLKGKRVEIRPQGTSTNAKFHLFVAGKNMGYFDSEKKAMQKAAQIVGEEVVTEGKLDDSIIRRDFPNVWAASVKDKEILKKFHAKVDTKNYKQMKDAYRNNIKKFVDDLKNVKLSDLLKSMQVKGGKWDGWMTDEVQKEEVIVEGTWAVPDSYRKLYNLHRGFMQNKMPATSSNAKKLAKDIYNLFGDDSFFDDLYSYEEKPDPKFDLRDLIKKHLEPWKVGFNSSYQIISAPESWYNNTNLKDEVQEMKRGKGNIKPTGLKMIRINIEKDPSEAVNPAQQAAIAIAKKEKEEKNESVFNSYRRMVEMWLDEEVSDLTVDPQNKLPKPADQNKHALEIVKNARRFGLKASFMGKHVRLKGAKKAVNDFLRTVVGRSSYGDPTEKDMSTPQIDKMLTKDLK